MRFSVIAVCNCGNRCRLASSSMTNHTGFCCGIGSFRSRKTRRSTHRLMRGRKASRMVGCEVIKIQPWRVSAHFVAVHVAVTSLLFGSKRKLSAVILSEPSTPVRWCGAFVSMSIQYSVPFTRRSISAGSDIHATSCAGVGRYVMRCAKIFCGASTKNLLVTPSGW